MRPPRRPRTLSREEAHLWGEIAKLITPLRGRVTLRKKAAPAAEAPAAAAGTATAKVSTGKVSTCKPSPGEVPAGTTGAAPDAGPKPVPPTKTPRRVFRLGASAPAPRMPAPPPAAPGAPGLERRERQRLSRGLLAIEGRIDLHGLYQAEAHAALVAFLMRARAAGHARVLVVTGKGGEARGEEAYAGRGVLRRSVPHWLRGAELSDLVLGFEEAARRHGGGGALYVRLRRR